MVKSSIFLLFFMLEIGLCCSSLLHFLDETYAIKPVSEEVSPEHLYLWRDIPCDFRYRDCLIASISETDEGIYRKFEPNDETHRHCGQEPLFYVEISEED